MNATVDEVNNTVTIETTHFSEYMLVDKSKWFDNWRNKIDYRTENKGYFDIAFVIDGSGSMWSNDPLRLRIEATKAFIDSFKDKDKGAVIEFESWATLYQGLTSDKNQLKVAADKIPSNGGTNLGAGVKCALDELETNGTNENRTVILLTDGQGNYDNSLNTRASNTKTKIYTIALGSRTNESLLKSIAFATGGEYYKATTSQELIATFEKVRDTSMMDETDTDGDGLPDIIEMIGMKTLNGQVIKTDSNNRDTDGDGKSDAEEMGEAITFIVPKEYKEYIDSYTYYPMYSNPLINGNNENDVTGDDYWDEEYDEIDFDLLNIESYIPGSVKMVFNTIGLDYNSFIECIVDNLSATFSLDFETTMNKKAIVAGILIGIDDCITFGVINSLFDYDFIYSQELNYFKVRMLTDCAITFIFGYISATSIDAIIAEGITAAGIWTIPIINIFGEATLAVAIPVTGVVAVASSIETAHAGYKFIDASNKLNDKINEIFNNNNVTWTNHGYKHFPPKNMSWKEIIKSTKTGPAKYSPDITDIEAFEREAWKSGTRVTNGKTWKVKSYDHVIGAIGGKETKYVRIENSNGTIHGHPISELEYNKLLK